MIGEGSMARSMAGGGPGLAKFECIDRSRGARCTTRPQCAKRVATQVSVSAVHFTDH